MKVLRFRLDVRKKVCRMRVVHHCNRFPREVMDVLPLKVFKVRLERAFSNLM